VNDTRELVDLERLAVSLGIEVRKRALPGAPGSGSGLCRVRGKWLLILNSHSTVHEKRAVLSEAIAAVKGKEEGERPGLASLGPKGRRRGA
jgi:hypothetical protein